ncbi:MAG: hypothetical protein IT431_00890 [Phycisphaerales bacterium]|nr:hypothetical protein [Phycisphaerales bacterium]
MNAAIQNYMSKREVTPYLEEARGLPALCLSYGVGAGPESTNGVIDGGYILPTFLHGARDLTSPRECDAMRDRVAVLPLLPIWPGLAFNTLFYALLWYLALASVRTVSHNHRYRRGLCPICRYDLRADYSQGCSECGWGR